MARFVYHRVSTCEQDFMQQKHCVDSYLERSGIKESDIKEQLIEKMTGVNEHTHRKFAKLLTKLRAGDTLFFSELSRIGRNMVDLNNIVNHCCNNGITLIQCKDGQRIENETIGGKALLFALSLAAEIEVANIRQRTQMALDARKKLLETDGCFISKSGRECTKLGRPKRDPEHPNDFDLSGVEAAAMANQNAKITWKENSSAYKWAMARVAEGMPRKEIIRLFNEQHALNPDVYCTREGKPLSKGVLSKWCREMNPLTV